MTGINKRSRPAFAAIAFIALFALGLTACGNQPPEYQQVKASDGRVVIPLSGVNDGKVHFFTYRHSGKRINFFIRTDGAGALSSYFDACFTCYRHKKGYQVVGSDLVCRECGLKFRIADTKWDNAQGCSPIYLKGGVEGNAYVIQGADIEKGARIF